MKIFFNLSLFITLLSLCACSNKNLKQQISQVEQNTPMISDIQEWRGAVAKRATEYRDLKYKHPNYNWKTEINIESGDISPVMMFKPTYPKKLLTQGQETQFKIHLTVNKSGRVTEIKLLQTNIEIEFYEKARQALRLWRFKPMVSEQTTEAEIIFKIESL